MNQKRNLYLWLRQSTTTVNLEESEMANAFSEVADENLVRDWVFRGISHSEISDLYQEWYPNMRGLSARSVRRFCKDREIHRISSTEVRHYVQDFIGSYGHGYGRRPLCSLHR